MKEFTYEELDFEEDSERTDKLVQAVLNTPGFTLQSLVMPFYYHNACWGTAADILVKLGFERIKALTPGLLKWMQDLNWYGSYTVFELLLTFPPEFLCPYVEQAVNEALTENDDVWIDSLAGLIYRGALKEEDFSDKKIFAVLKGHEKMMWGSDCPSEPENFNIDISTFRIKINAFTAVHFLITQSDIVAAPMKCNGDDERFTGDCSTYSNTQEDYEPGIGIIERMMDNFDETSGSGKIYYAVVRDENQIDREKYQVHELNGSGVNERVFFLYRCLCYGGLK